MINSKFLLNLNQYDIISLSKKLTRKINKFIKKLIDGDISDSPDNVNTLNIDLAEIVSQKKIKVVITVNNQKLIFYIDHCGNIRKNDYYYDDIINETLKSLDKVFNYDLAGLRESLKEALIASVNKTISEC